MKRRLRLARNALVYATLGGVSLMACEALLKHLFPPHTLGTGAQVTTALVFLALATALIYLLLLRSGDEIEERSFLQSRRNFQQLADAMPMIVWTADPNGRMDYVSRAFTVYTGVPFVPDRLEHWMHTVHPEDRERCRDLWKAALESGHPCEIEFRLLRAHDAAYRWHLLGAVPVRDDAGHILKWYGTATDIHESKNAEEVAKSHARELTTTLESITDAFFMLDREWRLSYVNTEGERLLQFPRPELIGENFWKKFPGTLDTIFETEYRKAMLTGISSHFETYYARRNMWFSVRVYPSSLGLAIYFNDITARKNAEAEREHLMAAVQQMEEIMLITDVEGVIRFVNPAFERITGFSREEAVGQTPRLLKSGIHDEAFYRDMWSTLLAGRTWKGRMVNRRKDGTRFTEEGIISPVFSETGALVNFVAIKNDISEKLLLEEQYRQGQKMEAVGRLAGGVAHDFNNMLTVILLRTELALRRTEASDPVHGFLKEIRESANRSADLTRQLLAYARQQPAQPRVLQLNSAVEAALQILRRLIGEDIDLAWLPGNPLWPVRMDPVQVDQLVSNLCVNARDAIEDVGTVTIETRNISFDEAYCRLNAGFIPGDYVMLAVSDTGRGMDRETQAHIFEPFFTTKEVGKGTGLGLATVYGIIKQNHGFINVYSEPGDGTSFRLYLPRYDDVEAPAEATPSGELQGAAGETILLIEDEPLILEATAEILRGIGYTVLEADGPGKALEIAGRHPSEIHLVLTDVIMPEMNGRDLVERLRSTRPGLKRVYMSGYTANVIVRRGIADKEEHFIQKPFSTTDLAATLRAALDAGAPRLEE